MTSPELPEEVKQAVRDYHQSRSQEKAAQAVKSTAAKVILPFIKKLSKKGEGSFTYEDLKVTLVEPMFDEFDVAALYNALKDSGGLTKEVKKAFPVSVDHNLLFQLMEELKVDRSIVQKHWRQREGTPSIRVTSSGERG